MDLHLKKGESTSSLPSSEISTGFFLLYLFNAARNFFILEKKMLNYLLEANTIKFYFLGATYIQLNGNIA